MSLNLKKTSLSSEFPNIEEIKELSIKWEKVKSELKNDFKRRV